MALAVSVAGPVAPVAEAATLELEDVEVPVVPVEKWTKASVGGMVREVTATAAEDQAAVAPMVAVDAAVEATLWQGNLCYV